MKIKTIIKILLLTLFILCIYSTNSNAMYQSKPGAAQISQAGSVWFSNVRLLEAPNYGMGLTEKTINTTTLVSNTPNNIDAHMMKNTEYGAMVLLGASDFGKQGTGTAKYMQNGTGDQVTTTGNYTGVYEVGKVWEGTASGSYNDSATDRWYYNAAAKYRNWYTINNTGSEIRGDATATTARWHGSGNSDWVNSWTSPTFQRGGNGAFSYTTVYRNAAFYTRAVVVNGNNF